MGYRPPKGVRPPQLEGKRTGRPKGSESHARVWEDIRWGYENRHKDRAVCPSRNARLWWTFAAMYPDQVEEFLLRMGKR